MRAAAVRRFQDAKSLTIRTAPPTSTFRRSLDARRTRSISLASSNRSSTLYSTGCSAPLRRSLSGLKLFEALPKPTMMSSMLLANCANDSKGNQRLVDDVVSWLMMGGQFASNQIRSIRLIRSHSISFDRFNEFNPFNLPIPT